MLVTPAQSKKSLIPFPLGRTTIGRYELLRPLASGGMATVFLGRLSGMAGFEKLVAVKVVHPHLVNQQEFVEMFLDEARLSAKIHHPNVVEIFEVGEEKGLYFMVAELIRGRSLKDLLEVAHRAKKRLEPRLFLTIIARICAALHAAHTLEAPDGSHLRLVHRDISPSNILISFNGFVKLIDFGIAFSHGRITTTRSGVIKGKFGYMAPEQLRGDPVDRRADIFSVGVLLYLFATGSHPFPADTEGEQVNRLLHTTPPSPSTIFAKIDPALERIINKALSKNPKHRHQTAEELGQDLGELLVPKGGFVDNADIAALMAHFFAQEIIDDRDALEQAMATRAKSNRHSMQSDGDSLGATSTGSDRIVPEKTPSTPHKGRVTETIDRPFQRTKKLKKRHALILTVIGVVAASVLVILLKMEPFGSEATDGPEPVSVSSAPHKEVGQPEVIDARAAEAKPVKGSIELLLKGLPKRAKVQLGGIDTAVIEGKITVPVDGRERELRVIVKGYLPYLRTIAPLEDGELTVRLRKRRAPRRKAGHNSKENKKAASNKLMECPYCDQ